MKKYIAIALSLVFLGVMVSFNVYAEGASVGAGAPAAQDQVGKKGDSNQNAQAGAQQAQTDNKKGDEKQNDKGNLGDQVKGNHTFQDSPWLLLFVIASFVIFFFIIILMMVRGVLLKSKKFSLADVLSEEASITLLDEEGLPVGEGGKSVAEGAKPVMITELRGSSSRVIAFMGMMVILLLFMGFGIFSLFIFATTEKIPDSQNILYYLMGGSMLFVPYGANQFSALFEKLTPKKP